eukprot:178879-Rhodomonas_salina.3
MLLHAHPARTLARQRCVAQVAIKTPKPSQLAEMEYAVQTFMAQYKTPAVGLCMGAAGKLSRVINRAFSAPSQLPACS